MREIKAKETVILVVPEGGVVYLLGLEQEI